MMNESNGTKKCVIRTVVFSMMIAVMAELLLFNASCIRDVIKNRPTVVASDAVTGDGGEYVTDDYTVDGYVDNVYVKDISCVNTEYLYMQVTLTDEGDEYEYTLPVQRIVPGVKGSGYVNIYPYGRVHTIRVSIDVPEGTSADIGSIEINGHKPYDVKPARLLLIFLLSAFLIHTFSCGWNIGFDPSSKAQIVCALIVCMMLIVSGKLLSVSNRLVVDSPWPHHKQYQELARSLGEGTVKVLGEQPSEELMAKENPYDTIALNVEDIPYRMDYAYHNGSYYVYFGIIPELLLYYPYYMITGRPLQNHYAGFIMYALLVPGVFMCIRELVIRYGADKRADKSEFPFAAYLLMCIVTCLFSNMVYLVARPDIYNIPIISATAFSFWGVSLWLLGTRLNGTMSRAAVFAGSFFIAMIAGCRPQMILIGAISFWLFWSMKKEDRPTAAGVAAFAVPFILVAIPVCWYNYARFGNIFDFGATYSLTTNDMNHRGFNINRLLRGMYCFLFQPAVMTTDYPFIASSCIESSYMGKNLTEYTYGGSFATNLILLSVFAPFIGAVKDISSEAKKVVLTLCAAALLIAGFDVNGAGILYRYTCDMIPVLLISALIVWIYLLKDRNIKKTAQRMFALLALCGLIYSFMVFMGHEGSVNLMDNNPYLYESFRQWFVL